MATITTYEWLLYQPPGVLCGSILVTDKLFSHKFKCLYWLDRLVPQRVFCVEIIFASTIVTVQKNHRIFSHLSTRWFVASALAFVLVGCFGDSFPPITSTAPPASCGNEICDLGFEDCDNCPEDCPCCSAISSVASSGVENPELAIGKADGQAATLADATSLILVVGREIYDGGTAEVDFKLEGTVDSASAVSVNACATGGSGDGAFEVLASTDGSRFHDVGLWTQETSEFDLGCAQMKSARFIQIRGLPGASATLDAITSTSCLDSNLSVTPSP